MRRYLALAVLALAPLACAQPLKLAVFDRLKEKASDSTEVNLNKDLLSLAGGFLGGDKGADAAKLKKLTDGLQGVLVRSLEFDKEGAYTSADVQSLMSEMAGPGWNLVVSADEKHGTSHEISRIWIKSGGSGEVGGMRILSAEAKELSVIEISGKVRLEDIKDLGGSLGIPDINIDKTPKQKEDEE